jgi:glucuronyl esterase-like protein
MKARLLRMTLGVFWTLGCRSAQHPAGSVNMTQPAHPSAASVTATPPAAHLASPDELPNIPELPDPFLFLDGSRVRTASDWQRRRSELKELIQFYEYGHMPPPPDKLAVAVRVSDGPTGSRATLLTLDLTLSVGDIGGAFPVSVALPSGPGPFPAFISTGGLKQQMFLERGYAVVEFNPRDVAADAAGRQGPFYTLYPETDAGALMAWAWGFGRVVDALASVSSIRPDRLAVTGHSRFGKAALLAGAFDERIALTLPASSGLAGTGNYRYFFEASGENEKIENITGRFPYWFTPRLASFVGHPERLPFDQHSLMALVAPRALLTTSGTEDSWGNPAGTQLSHEAAQLVYTALGVPERIGIHFRAGGHPMSDEDFSAMLDFADAQPAGDKRPAAFDRLAFPHRGDALSWAALAPGRLEGVP